MNNQLQSEELDLKQLLKKSLEICKNKKKTFVFLFTFIMLITTALFIKELISPEYKSEILLKSRFVKKDQLQSIIDAYNSMISFESYNKDYSEIVEISKKNKIKKFELIEIKSEPNSPDKNDGIRLYKLNIIYKTKPAQLDDINLIIKNIQDVSSRDNDIVSTKAITYTSIAEIDTLLKVATDAGNAFRTKINMPGNMMVMNDLYKSLNDILSKKADLQVQLASLQNSNIIYSSSSWVLTKSVKIPLLFFFIGFGLWFIICAGWVAIELILKDIK